MPMSNSVPGYSFPKFTAVFPSGAGMTIVAFRVMDPADRPAKL